MTSPEPQSVTDELAALRRDLFALAGALSTVSRLARPEHLRRMWELSGEIAKVRNGVDRGAAVAPRPDVADLDRPGGVAVGGAHACSAGPDSGDLPTG